MRAPAGYVRVALGREHRWQSERTLLLESRRHKSVNWIVTKYRESMWWWFLVEMWLSLVLVVAKWPWDS